MDVEKERLNQREVSLLKKSDTQFLRKAPSHQFLYSIKAQKTCKNLKARISTFTFHIIHGMFMDCSNKL